MPNVLAKKLAHPAHPTHYPSSCLFHLSNWLLPLWELTGISIRLMSVSLLERKLLQDKELPVGYCSITHM